MLKNSLWQYFLPQHALSRAAGFLANSDVIPLKNFLIKKFIEHYKVDLSDALLQDPSTFETFNDFFTRALKPGARTIDPSINSLISPADGTLSEWGQITQNTLLQAKNQHYSLERLVGGQELARPFEDGYYATVYLAPKDYHRVHMPMTGTLEKMMHIPGRLFSVNQKTAEDIPEIFARNERVVCIFKTTFGPMAVVLVGAMIVASIATVWHGQVTPISGEIQTWDYTPQPITLEKGVELGRFYLGSTAILLLPKESVEWDANLVVGQALKMGQKLADF